MNAFHWSPLPDPKVQSKVPVCSESQNTLKPPAKPRPSKELAGGATAEEHVPQTCPTPV